MESSTPEPLARPPFSQACFPTQANQSQPLSLEDLPFLRAIPLVFKHKLNKIYLEISLGFSLNFYLVGHKNPNTSDAWV